MFFKIMINASGQKFLIADDADAEGFLEKKQIGLVVKGKMSSPRNVKHHKKLFALINLYAQYAGFTKMAAEAKVSNAALTDALLDKIKLAVGHCNVIEWEGKKITVPMTIKFDSMGQDDFKIFYESVIMFIMRELPNIASSPDELDKMAEEIARF